MNLPVPSQGEIRKSCHDDPLASRSAGIRPATGAGAEGLA